MKKTKIIVGIMLLFFSGVITGFMGHRLHMKHMMDRFHKGNPKERVDFIVRKLSQELDLEQTQKEKVKQILTRADLKITKLTDSFHPRITEVMEESMALIKKELNENQLKKFEKIHKEMKEKKDHFPPPPFPYHKEKGKRKVQPLS